MNELLLLAQQARFGQSSEKREYVLKGGEQMRLFNEAEQLQDPKAPEPTQETIVAAYTRKPKRPQDELLKDLPVRKIVLELGEDQRRCDTCGSELTPIGEKFLRRELNVIPRQVEVIEYYTRTYACKTCEEKTGYGQENNPTTYNLARMNMLMHGVDYQDFDIYKGDTLTNDMYGEDLKLTVQVCNPPYSLKWNADSRYLDDPRFSGVGKLAPKSHADLAFLQHMVYHMDDVDGRIAVLLPHGVLFRGGAEEDIRKFLIRDLNRLDAVIGLPANLFHGASIPVVVLVLKTKRNGNSGNILFVDASKEYKPGKVQNELTDENIQKIVDTYISRKDVPKYAHVALMQEIIDNGYNLNIPRYVDTSEEEEEIDLAKVTAELAEITAKKQAAIDKVNAIMKELGL